MHRLDEPFTYKYDVYRTMRQTFEEICDGQSPWVPLGKFMNHWYADHPDERGRLITDPLPETYPQKYHQWAVFCASSVEWFSHTYNESCPEWVHNPRYMLEEPWYFGGFGSHAELRKITPPEFARRNVFCGADIYANKWEFVADLWVRYPEKLAALRGRPDEELLPYIEAARQRRALRTEETPG